MQVADFRPWTDPSAQVEDFQFWIDAGQYVEDGLGKAIRGGGGLKGVMYEAGGWEATHRGGPWRVRERQEGEELDRQRRASRHSGRIRLPDESEEEGKAEPSRYVKPGIRELRKLDKARWERDSRGLPGFVCADHSSFPEMTADWTSLQPRSP